MMEMMQRNKIDFTTAKRIIFPGPQLQAVYEHCRRKLNGNYLDKESRELKAFGLVAGCQTGPDLFVSRCFPLMKNARKIEPYRKFMDNVMAQHAIPSETPLTKRGWVADPEELMACIKECQRQNLFLLGAYHMHRVAWPDDPLRDTPTVLDTILAAKCGMLIFIISMVKVDQPVIRAFFEGKSDMEIPIIVENFAK